MNETTREADDQSDAKADLTIMFTVCDRKKIKMKRKSVYSLDIRF